MKGRFYGLLAAILACGSLVAGEVDATIYSWEADKQPESAYEGKVKFTYDVNKRLSTIRVTEFPDASKKLTFTGDAMSFTNGNSYVRLVPGEVVFENEVTGTTFFCECIDYSTYSKRTHGSGDTFLTKDWQAFLPNASLDDWMVSSEVTKMSSAGVSNKSGWSNPDNEMYACAVKRIGDVVTFQYQTDAMSSTAGGWFSKCVKVEMKDGDSGIMVRALATTYVVRSATQSDVNHGYDVDNLKSGMTRENSALFVLGKTSGYGVNIMKFKRITPLATVRFRPPYGSKQISLLSPQSFVNVVMEDASTMRANSSVYPRTNGRLSLRDSSLNWTGMGNGGDGDIYFEATKAIAGEAGTVAPEDPEPFFSTTAIKVAENRQLRDLVVCTNRAIVVNANGTYPNDLNGSKALDADKNYSWAMMCGSYLADATTTNHDRHPGNLYNLKFTDKTYTKATVQVQCQNSASLRCVYLQLEQQGNDVYARALGNWESWSVASDKEATQAAPWYSDKFIGTDFDLIRATMEGLTSDEKKAYGFTAQIRTWSGTDYTKIDGIGVRALTLVFRKPANHLITSKNPCKIVGGNYVVSGRDDATMALSILDPGGLPTNGTMTVKAGGELWFCNGTGGNGALDGVSKGTCALLVEKGGLVRQRGSYPFGSAQKIEISGGKIVFEGTDATSADNNTYLNAVTLKDGAELLSSTMRGVRLGNVTNDSVWTVGGTAPSTNAVAVMPLSDENSRHLWVLDVSDTGDFAADFVQDGEIRTYRTVDPGIALVRLQAQGVEKRGEGTMLLNGDYSHVGPLSVVGGTFVLGKSGIWSGGVAVTIDNGATFESAADTSNTTLGTLTVGANGAAIALGEGSTLAFADSQACDWEGSLSVTMPTNALGQATATLQFANGVTDAQLRKISVNGKRADVTDDGQIVPGNFGMLFIIR